MQKGTVTSEKSLAVLQKVKHNYQVTQSFPDGSDGKTICPQRRRPRFDPWTGKIPWERKWLPTPVFWPGKSHGQRSLVPDYKANLAFLDFLPFAEWLSSWFQVGELVLRRCCCLPLVPRPQ